MELNNFYPRSPCGERRQWRRSVKLFRQFLSTLSLRRATHYDNYNLHCVEISIHALLAESDTWSVNNPPSSYTISIHALLAESDRTLECTYNAHVDFYPRSPCGERHYFSGVMRQNPGISIHALLAESDETS